VPLLWLRRSREGPGGRLPTFAYFLLLGLAFMLLEIVFILKFTHFLGDPILSAAGILAAFLVFSGLGSVVSGRLFERPVQAIAGAAAGIAALVMLSTVGLDWVFRQAAAWPTGARLALSILLTGAPAFLMGWPFPGGLSSLKRQRPALLPWAWGINGFASVAGAPLAMLLAVEVGFRGVLLIAALLYVAAGLVALRLPGARDGYPLR